MSGSENLMTIGDFARGSGLTPKALRLYDDLGLLVPAEVDERSGYRRYAAAQLESARLVATLRLVGMPLTRIKHVLGLSAADAADEIETYWRQVEADTGTRRGLVTTLVHELRSEVRPMSRTTTTLHARLGVSHRQGARKAQQDAVLATPELIAVADGIGDSGDVAELALAAYVTGGLASAITEVANAVGYTRNLPSRPESGTTLTAVELHDATARVTHIGDARLYLVRDGAARQITHDHTVVASLIELGQLSWEEARTHEHRNLLNRALVPGVVADETVVDLVAGDRLVLTTDGIHSYYPGEQADLEALLAAPGTPQEVADAVAAAVAGAGEPDNHTIVVADLS